LIDENIDLDLLSLFLQRYVRIMVEIERGASFSRSTMEGERGKKRAIQGRRRGGVFIPPPIKINVTVFQAGLSGPGAPPYLESYPEVLSRNLALKKLQYKNGSNFAYGFYFQ
jgi:hypothetical protein